MPSLISTLQKAHPNLSLIKHFYSVTPKQLIVNDAQMQNFFHVYDVTAPHVRSLFAGSAPFLPQHLHTDP